MSIGAQPNYKYDNSFIEEVLLRADVVALIGAYVRLRKTGHNHVGLCPFHSEKTPSFSVSATKQLYHCFGCGASGNAITFLQQHDHLSFIDALTTLAQHAGVPLPEAMAHEQKRHTTQQPLYDALMASAHFFQQQLRNHSVSGPAITYLQQRGLSGAICSQYGIGYATEGWDHLLRYLREQNFNVKVLQEAGLVIHQESGKLYDRFRHRIMFPIRDIRGRVIGFGGRVLIPEEHPKYLNSPESPIFHKKQALYGLYEALQNTKRLHRIVVVEGYMDVIALAQQQFFAVVATLGTATSSDHLHKLLQHTREIIFCFDGDTAGRLAAWRALEMALPLLQDDWQARFAFLPAKEDPDSFVRQHGLDAFEQVLQQATPLPEFLVYHLTQECDIAALAGRAQFANRAMGLLKKMPQNFIRQLLLERVAQVARISLHELQASLNNQAPPQKAAPPSQVSSPKLRATLSPIRVLLRLLLLQPKLALLGKQQPAFGPEALQLPGFLLLQKVLDACIVQSEANAAILLANWADPDEKIWLEQLATWEAPLPEEAYREEFIQAWRQLTAKVMEQQITQLLTKASQQGLDATEKNLLRDLIATRKKPP